MSILKSCNSIKSPHEFHHNDSILCPLMTIEFYRQNSSNFSFLNTFAVRSIKKKGIAFLLKKFLLKKNLGVTYKYITISPFRDHFKLSGVFTSISHIFFYLTCCFPNWY